jgi:hypothetical protein
VCPATAWALYPQTPAPAHLFSHFFSSPFLLRELFSAPDRLPPPQPNCLPRDATEAAARGRKGARPPPQLHRPPPRFTDFRVGAEDDVHRGLLSRGAHRPRRDACDSSSRRRRRWLLSLAAAPEFTEDPIAFSFSFQDSMAFCFLFRDMIAFYISRAGLNSYDLPNKISAELSSAHTSYQTQYKKLYLYKNNLARFSLS